MTHAASPAGRDEGMVLIEVLAALSIVALMSGLMLGFLGQLRAVGDLQRDVAIETELSAAAGHLQRTLAAARAIPVAAETEAAAVFEGGASSMHFSAVTRRGFQALALREMRIGTVLQGGKRVLVQSMTPKRPANAARSAPVNFVIADDLSGARFEYADDKGAFFTEWQNSELPAAVRITLWRVSGGRSIAVQALARTR